MSAEVEIEFPEGYFGAWKEGDRMTGEMDTPTRGCLDVIVRIGDRRYEIHFYDPIRLGQEMSGAADRDGFAAEVAVVVLPEVNTEAIRRAVRALVTRDFFTHLTPLGAESYVR